MTYLLDTNTCIGWLRQNQPQIVARIQTHAQTDIVLCSVVVGELLFGVERSDPVHRANTGVRVDRAGSGQLRRKRSRFFSIWLRRMMRWLRYQ